MTQSPADILLRIEQLLRAGKQQEARLLLAEYLKLDPASARAWWLLSLTITDVKRQVDCLQYVIRLDPKNEPARERLAKLISQPPVLPSVSPFAVSGPAEIEESKGDIPLTPAWATTGSAPETIPQQPSAEQTVSPEPPAPIEPAGKAPPPRKSKTKWGLWFILMGVFVICLIAYVEYSSLQGKSQAQPRSLQETFAVAQTLTNLQLPTLIPTWTASPTRTALPTATFTKVPTLTPALIYTLTKTPRPSSRIGPAVGLYAPDFSLTSLTSGQQITLSQFDGQPVLLFFWSSVCSQCTDEIGSIETISLTYKDAGLIVLAIDVAEDPATVTIFRSAHSMTVPILLDPDSAIQSAYQVDALPRHFFVNSSGTIASIGLGEMTLDELIVQVDAIMRRYSTSTP